MKPIKAIFAVAALLFILSACASEVSRTTEPLPTAIPPAADTPTPPTATPPAATPTTATPTATATPVPTPTPTPAPTATPLPTPTPLPTVTPIPPLDPLPAVVTSEIPHVFVGKVTIGGVTAIDNTDVSVWLAEFDAPIGTGITSGGNYTVLANQHGSQSFVGQFLIFKVNGLNTAQTAVWQKGGATILDLSLN